jgi:putative SOS response-associated peptidase YedK
LSMGHWGLIPCWAKDTKIGYKMINARAETVATKPAFRAAYKARRCLIPAEGFYEWKRDVAPRRPHYIHKRDGSPMALAGIWETWKGPDETIESCAIITTAPNALMATLHNRMPVILDPAHFDWWMTGSTEEVGQLLVPCPPEELGAYPISRRVNNPRNEGSELRLLFRASTAAVGWTSICHDQSASRPKGERRLRYSCVRSQGRGGTASVRRRH